MTPRQGRPAPPPTTRATLWSRRVRALLAAGVVLGAGATVTMAAWNDSEYATGTVTAATFALEGSVDGSTFSASDASAPHALGFSPAADLVLGATSYALFSVRTQAGSTAGSVRVLADDGNTSGLNQYLTYGLRTVDVTTCDSGTFEIGAVVVERGTAMTSDAPSSQPVAADQGSTVNYCLELTLDSDAPNEAQGATASPLWQFLGTSTSE